MSRIFLIALLAVSFGFGCKGCDGDAPALPRGVAPAASGNQSADSRLSTRNLDRSKAYPKDAEGRVTCESDVDCFILQAEGCQKATFTHVESSNTYGVDQRVNARYQLEGKDGEDCKLVREALGFEVVFDPKLEEAMRAKPDGEKTVAKVKDDVLKRLRDKNPARKECKLSSERVLTVALDVADGKPALTQGDCKTITPESSAPAADTKPPEAP